MEKERESAATVKGRRGTREEKGIWERSRRRAEGRWGGRFRTTLPGHWDWGETYGNCFLITRGWVRATNDYCLKYAGKWQMDKYRKEICMRAGKRVIPSPLIVSTCTCLACSVVLSGTLLHVHKGAWLHGIQKGWVAYVGRWGIRLMGDWDVRCKKRKKIPGYLLLIPVYWFSQMFCVGKKTGMPEICRLPWCQRETEKAQHGLGSWVQRQRVTAKSKLENLSTCGMEQPATWIQTSMEEATGTFTIKEKLNV